MSSRVFNLTLLKITSCSSRLIIRRARSSFQLKHSLLPQEAAIQQEIGRMQFSLGLKSAIEQMQSKFLTEKEKNIFNLLQHTESFIDFEKLLRSFAILLAAHDDIDSMYPALIQSSGPANASFCKNSFSI